jgi:hypothetical protein
LEIGKPQRIHRVEPFESPVAKPEPVRGPEKAPTPPTKAPIELRTSRTAEAVETLTQRQAA